MRAKRSLALLLLLCLAAPWARAAAAETDAASLSALVDAALKRHPEARAAAARATELAAGAAVAEALTPAPPALSVAHVNDRAGSDRGWREYELGVGVPLWLPGQRAAGQALAAREQSAFTSRGLALRWEVAAEVVARWSDARGARVALSQAERRLAQARALEADAQRRLAAGDIARADANLVTGERLDAAAALLEAGNAVREAEARWQVLTARPLPDAIGAPGAASQAHPLLDSARGVTRAAQARVQVARSATREAPELALRAIRERGDLQEPWSNRVGVELTIPFSSAPHVSRAVAAADAELARADAEEARLHAELELQRERSTAALAAARERLEFARQRDAVARDNQALAERAWQLGEIDTVTRLRAQAQAMEAELALARAHIELNAAELQERLAEGATP